LGRSRKQIEEEGPCVTSRRRSQAPNSTQMFHCLPTSPSLANKMAPLPCPSTHISPIRLPPFPDNLHGVKSYFGQHHTQTRRTIGGSHRDNSANTGKTVHSGLLIFPPLLLKLLLPPLACPLRLLAFGSWYYKRRNLLPVYLQDSILRPVGFRQGEDTVP